MGLFSKLLGKEVKKEVEYDISDSQIDPKFVALYIATNDFMERISGMTNKDPFTLLEKLLVESSKVHESLFGSNDKADVSIIDTTVAAAALVSYNGEPSDDDFTDVYRIISTSITAAIDDENIQKYNSMGTLIASFGLKGMIESI